MVRKQKQKKIIDWNTKETYAPANISAPARNMRKTDLCAVIFGCKHSTINECLSNQLFGLPASHWSYIRNISQGLVLFLFNYSDRKLHGIYEAASSGQMNINRNAWVADGDDYKHTSYPAQVRIRVIQQCKPLVEKDFKPIIVDNYYEANHFYFELDHDQTNKLIMLFTSSPTNILPAFLPAKKPAVNVKQNWLANGGFNYEIGSSSAAGLGVSAKNPNQASGFSYATVLCGKSTMGEESQRIARITDEAKCYQTWESYFQANNTAESNAWEESQIIPATISEVESLQIILSDSSPKNADNLDLKCFSFTDTNEADVEEINKKDNPSIPDTEKYIDLESLVVKLMQEVQTLKGLQLNQTVKINLLEQELNASRLEIQQLRTRIGVLEIRRLLA